MSKKMLINATLPEEDRVAIVEDGTLTELDIETAGHQQTKGNIYKGEVIRVEQGLQAAFIDYGAQRPGFLQIGEIHPSLYPKRDDEGQSNRRPPITEILKRGQQILVQVVKEERGTKGAALTTEVSLPGRYMVLIPQSSSRGISRKIDNDHVRKEIKNTLSSLELPDNMGYIIRTAAIDQPPEELKRDFDYLLNTYNSIVSHSEKAKAPALIYQESNLVLRSIRDYFSPEIDEVLIDDREVFQEARDFFKAVMPEYMPLVKLHQERRPIFARYQIEEQISHLSSNTVNLPSGGSIVLDQTEALVAIDVNSGKMGGEQDVEATAHRVNLEAAVEVARQLRLRDMGGLIVIDFIDMRQRRNAREVEKALKNALKIDKARVTVGRISHQFGLLEMSRQRIKANLGEGSYNMCPHCQGSGRIRSDESRSIALLRRIQAGTAKGHIEAVVCTAALDTANYLLNNKRRELYDLEQRYKLTIEIKGDPGYLPEQIDIEFVKQSREPLQENHNAPGPLVDTDLSERANIDVVLPETSSTEQEPPENDQKDEKGDETPRKSPRRRRRPNRRRNDRNKRSEETNDETAAEVSQAATDQDQQKTAQAQTPQPTETPAQPEQTLADEKGTEAQTQPSPPVESQEDTTKSGDAPEETDKAKTSRKPARRRPARKKTPPKETEQTEQTASEVNAADERFQQKVSTDSASVESDTQTEKKPTRRAPRRKPVATSDASAEVKSDNETSEAAEETKPAPRRRRTTRKTATADATTPAEAVPDTAQESAKSSEKKAAPAKKTTRRKTTAKTTTASETASAEATQTDSNDAPPEKKPVRRRRTTTKKAPEKAAEATEKPAETAAEGTEETPKKKTTRRRTTTTKKAVDDTEKPADADKLTEKKPTRSRTTRKTTTEESSEKETPKKTTRSKKSTEKAAEEGEEKPKRRAPRKKKAEPAPETDA
ncbi:Rne/Rng family ribonuclease [uncultured Desulfuromonas sp.]|uniref:Rne/Rng family ribonuclease n=1 Tax=uncultured Desulfuromonas sp. TaxID=181013 RepID=UPI002AAB2D43|nr:Rne/Rng family ribonuclease [uncultured Desulfuromonas sp.]